MKLFFAMAFALAIIQLNATATVCNEDGSYCKEVSKVSNGEEWLTACCDNVSYEDTWTCTDDCALAKQDQPPQEPAVQELTPKNAYVLFNQGYRAWVLVNGTPDPMPQVAISVEVIREYLPAARRLFLDDPTLEMAAFDHSDAVEIIVKKPDKPADLSEKIVFTDWQRFEQTKVQRGKRERFDRSITISPNPAHPDQVLKINYGQELNVERLEILSTNGRLVKTITGRETPQKIDLSTLDQSSTSLNLRIITQDGRVFTKKIILD